MGRHADAQNRDRGALTAPQRGPPGSSAPAQERRHRVVQSRLGDGHHVPPDEAWLRVYGRPAGLGDAAHPWTAWNAGATTCSWSGCGGRSGTRRFTCAPTTPCPRQRRAWAGRSRSTARGARTVALTDERPITSASHRCRRWTRRLDPQRPHLRTPRTVRLRRATSHEPARAAERGDQAPHEGGPDLPQPGVLAKAGTGAVRRDTRPGWRTTARSTWICSKSKGRRR